MTEWEKERMSTAPQDCLRTFRLNAEAPGGWSEYGETMLDFESTETLTEDNGKAKIALLKADAVAPLPCGTFLRMYLFGQISDGVPVWQTDENGEPKNYRNYYVTSAKSRWFRAAPDRACRPLQARVRRAGDHSVPQRLSDTFDQDVCRGCVHVWRVPGHRVYAGVPAAQRGELRLHD